MFKKTSTTVLILIFVGLLAIVGIDKFISYQQGGRNFRSNIASFDPEEVTSVSIINKGNTADKIRVYKASNDIWNVSKGDKSYNADTGKIQRMLSKLVSLEPEAVTATDREDWQEYQVTDSSATRVIVKKNNNTVADVYIGKFSYGDMSSMRNLPRRVRRQRMQQSMRTYVRLAEEPNVYPVSGFLKRLFTPKVEAYRNKVVVRSNTAQLNKLKFNYPGDSSFVMQRSQNTWSINGRPVDSASVTNYLSEIRQVTSRSFAEKNEFQNTKVKHTLRMQGGRLKEPIVIKAMPYGQKEGDNLITSSLNQGTVFKSTTNNKLFNKLFKGKTYFFTKSE